jgi:hypothetical protein
VPLVGRISLSSSLSASGVSWISTSTSCTSLLALTFLSRSLAFFECGVAVFEGVGGECGFVLISGEVVVQRHHRHAAFLLQQVRNMVDQLVAGGKLR